MEYMQVDEDISQEGIGNMLSDALDFDSFKEHMTTSLPESISAPVTKVAEVLHNGSEKLVFYFDDLMQNWRTHLSHEARELLIQTTQEKIKESNNTGLRAFQQNLIVGKDTGLAELAGENGQ
jgi:oligoendopeptidase F